MSAVDIEETLWNLALELDDCLLSIESLKEHSLLDTDRRFFLGAERRQCRQGTCSASVFLVHKEGKGGRGQPAKLVCAGAFDVSVYWKVYWLKV